MSSVAVVTSQKMNHFSFFLLFSESRVSDSPVLLKHCHQQGLCTQSYQPSPLDMFYPPRRNSALQRLYRTLLSASDQSSYSQHQSPPLHSHIWNRDLGQTNQTTNLPAEGSQATEINISTIVHSKVSLHHFCSYLVKKFRPNLCQWSFMISSTLCLRVARIESHANTAHRPSFSRMWSEPTTKTRL